MATDAQRPSDNKVNGELGATETVLVFTTGPGGDAEDYVTMLTPTVLFGPRPVGTGVGLVAEFRDNPTETMDTAPFL